MEFTYKNLGRDTMPSPKQTVEMVEPLLKVLRNKVLPWAQRGAMERAVIARPDRHDLARVQKNLPTGITVERRELRGRRISVKGPRDYGNHSTRSAYWPEDGMNSRRIAHLAWVVSGRLDFQLGNTALHAREGDLIFLLPETPFPDGSTPHLDSTDGHCDLLWIALSGEGNSLGCWICHSQDGRHFEKPFESCYLLSSQSRNLFYALIEEVSLMMPRYQAVCDHLIAATLTSVVRELETGNFFQFAYQMEGDPRKASSEDPVQQAKNYIDAHLHKHLTIDAVAQSVYLSRTQFIKLFREQSGQSFIEYLTTCRLEEAKMLLSSTKWSVDMVGKKVGVTPSRLRTIFQDHLGMSPREYRRQEQEKHENINRKQGIGIDRSTR